MPPPDPLMQPEGLPQPGTPPIIPCPMDSFTAPANQMAVFQEQLAADMAVPAPAGPLAPTVPDQYEDSMSLLMDKLEADMEAHGRQAEMDFIMGVMERAAEIDVPPPDVPPPATFETVEPPKGEIYTGPQGPTEPAAPPPGLIDEPRGWAYIEPPLPQRRGGGGRSRARSKSFTPRAGSFSGRSDSTSRSVRCKGDKNCEECKNEDCPVKKAAREEGSGT